MNAAIIQSNQGKLKCTISSSCCAIIFGKARETVPFFLGSGSSFFLYELAVLISNANRWEWERKTEQYNYCAHVYAQYLYAFEGVRAHGCCVYVCLSAYACITSTRNREHTCACWGLRSAFRKDIQRADIVISARENSFLDIWCTHRSLVQA